MTLFLEVKFGWLQLRLLCRVTQKSKLYTFTSRHWKVVLYAGYINFIKKGQSMTVVKLRGN